MGDCGQLPEPLRTLVPSSVKWVQSQSPSHGIGKMKRSMSAHVWQTRHVVGSLEIVAGIILAGIIYAIIDISPL